MSNVLISNKIVSQAKWSYSKDVLVFLLQKDKNAVFFCSVRLISMATKCLCSLGVFGMGVQTCPPKNKLILCYSAVSFLHNICFSFFMIIPSLINVAAEYKYLLMFFCAKLFWLQWLLHSCIKVKYGQHTITHKYDTEISTQ